MNSFILRVRNLSALAENVLRSEATGFRYCAAHRRTLFTSKNLLISISTHCEKFTSPNIQNYQLPSNSERNLGKVIDLDVNFEDVKIDFDETPRRIKKVKKESKLKGTHAPEQNLEEDNEEELQETAEPKTKISESIEKNDSLFRSVMLKLKSSKFKEKKQKIILEGKRIIHDAITAGSKPEMIFYTRKVDLDDLNLPDDAKIFRISFKSCKLWTDLVTPQGIFGVFKMPVLTELKENSNPIPLTIVCDNIREPGNLGTILRVAVGVGCEKVILSKGCVDIWHSKVLRAGAGAHFHLCIRENFLWSDIEAEISEDSKIFLADLTRGDVKNMTDTENEKHISPFTVKSEGFELLPLHCYSSVKYTNENTVIVIGGETHGLCSEAYEFAARRKGVRVFIPLSNGIESLNNSVALGILAYEFKRQLSPVEDSSLPAAENADSVVKEY